MLCAHDETDRTNWVEAIRKVSSEGHSSAATPIVPLMQASAAAERGEWEKEKKKKKSAVMW